LLSLNFKAISASESTFQLSTTVKLSSFRIFLALFCSICLISYVFAAPGGAPGRPTTGPGSGGSSGNPGGGNGPGFSQDNNPGQQGQSASDGTRFNSQDNPGKTGSAFGRDNASSAGSSSSTGRGESVTDTGDRSVGEETSTEKSGNSEKDQTFKAILMDSGLTASDSPSTHGTPGQPPFGTPPGKHLGWEKGKKNPHRSSPSPSATASASPSASASVSPTASATATATATTTP